MKYFKKGDILLSDFDGVFLDSQSKFEEVMKDETDSDEWLKYLRSINWKKFIRDCELMPYALETFLELQNRNILRAFLIKIHSTEEGESKRELLRELGIIVPIIYVLPPQNKSQIVLPKPKIVLLEDKEENATDWEMNGGRAIIYNPESKEENKRLVKRLDSLLLK